MKIKTIGKLFGGTSIKAKCHTVMEKVTAFQKKMRSR